ncbi:MAG: IS481 family transposase [Gammaproteobacteria bacterium]
MNSHKHARLTPYGRALLVRRMLEEGLRPEEAAQAAGVSVRTAYKWRRRYLDEGELGLQDRSSRPASCPHQTSESLSEQILTLRRERRTYRQIHQLTGVSVSTIGRVLARAGLNRLAVLDPPRPARRYTWERPGQMLHLDIKKLGRFRRPGHRVTGDRRRTSDGAGWDYVHVAVDDASRLSLSTVHPDETGRSACRALVQAIRYYRGFGITIERVMTDNGACYKSKRFARLLRRLGIRHLRTKPYTPRTNGKAERFIQTALREWAYARSYDNSTQRAQHLPLWLHQYNWHRPHASLGYQPPVSTLNLHLNNLVGLHS